MQPSFLREIAVLETLEISKEGSEGFHDVLQALVDSAVRLTGADRVSLVLFDEKTRIKESFHRGDGWDGDSLKAQRGSKLVAPLGAGRRIGTLTVIRPPDQPEFGPEDAETLTVFAQLAADRIRWIEAQHDVSEALAVAEAANHSKTNFLSNLSHELRTPLNGILGFSHLLESSATDPSQLAMVQAITQSGQRLLATVDNLLELAQFESGQFQLEISPFSPKGVLVSVLSKSEPSAREKNLSWNVDISPKLPVILQGDAVRLGLAWNQILSNAVKFTSTGTISIRLDGQNLASGGFELVFTVEDTGIGMVTDQVGRGFVPFRQEDETLTRKYGGTGLGLALCDRIVRQMGGNLELWGKPGTGTKVRVRVELREEAQP